MEYEPDPTPTPSPTPTDKERERKRAGILHAIHLILLGEGGGDDSPQPEHGAGDASEAGMQAVDRQGNPIRK